MQSYSKGQAVRQVKTRVSVIQRISRRVSVEVRNPRIPRYAGLSEAFSFPSSLFAFVLLITNLLNGTEKLTEMLSI